MAFRNTFFHQEIADDGRVLSGDRMALLSSKRQSSDGSQEHIFFIRKLQVIDMCSSRRQTGFAPLGESHGEGTDRHTILPWTDFANTRKNRPKGPFFENIRSQQKIMQPLRTKKQITQPLGLQCPQMVLNGLKKSTINAIGWPF